MEIFEKGYNPELPVLKGAHADPFFEHLLHLVAPLARHGGSVGRQKSLTSAGDERSEHKFERQPRETT